MLDVGTTAEELRILRERLCEELKNLREGSEELASIRKTLELQTALELRKYYELSYQGSVSLVPSLMDCISQVSDFINKDHKADAWNTF